MEQPILHFDVIDRLRRTPLDFTVKQVICAGYSGRSREAVQAHVDELIALGMPAPESTPIFFMVSTYLASTGKVVTVQDRYTSGEVEFALLFHDKDVFVTCGSDHTHRGLEKHSIPGAKQMHPKILAPELWRFSDVVGHWDQIRLRSWATANGERKLYQDATLAHIMAPGELLETTAKRYDVRTDGTVFMSGTIPTAGGHMVYADRFEFEMSDPVLNRTLAHQYDVVLLK